MKKGRLTSIYLTQTYPPGGFWSPGRGSGSLNRQLRWQLNGSSIDWSPHPPPDEELRTELVLRFPQLIEKARQGERFLKLSGTTKTGITWSLPAVASCPIVDETCGSCYALDGFYRTNLAGQVGRVLRLEYLRELIKERRIDSWVNWIANKIGRLKPVETVPNHLLSQSKRAYLESQDATKDIAFFRWHDSGDLFHAEYAIAVLEVCRRTPSVLHWIPTRMGPLLASLVSDGERLPGNVAVQVSAHRGGTNEELQIDSVKQILRFQPSATIGLTYAYQGSASRVVDPEVFNEVFGGGAHLCPATVAERSEDRVCNGCRRCWAQASVGTPIVYAVHLGN